MATSSRQLFDMPGLFTPERLSSISGPDSNMFVSAPGFPLAGETNGRHVTGSTAHETRKRSRPDASNFSRPHMAAANSWGDSSLAYSRLTNAKSPPPLANDRYQLAGGMERPEMSARHTGDYDDYFQLEKQRGMWSTVASPSSGLQNQLPSNAIPPTPNGTKPWMLDQILKVVGGVAGTLAHFCSRPFRGFQAGGGQAYTFGSDGEIAATDHRDAFINHTARAMPAREPLPGEFPEDNYGVLSIESLDSERPRTTKRARTGENWVMIDQDGGMQSRPSTPRLSERRAPNHTKSPSQIPRPVSGASRSDSTPKRPSLIPVSRRSTADRSSLQRPSRTPSKPPSTPRSYTRQSYGSPAMFKDTSTVERSPLPPESQRLINKMRREELEDEARMRRMSSQMSQMLREAQQALGSKFKVEDDCTGSGGMSE